MWEKGKAPLPNIYHVYLTTMKLGAIILYLEKIEKTYKSRDSSPVFC